MYVIKLKNVVCVFGVVLLFVLGISYQQNMVRKVETMSQAYSELIVVDAGHGLPDGGATAGDVIEAELNLSIAKKLESELLNRGYDVIMTRENENNIADNDKQSSLSTMKSSDLTNRVNIINNSGADFCISIHMNKFENTKYWGWQTFYNKNSNEGKKLAQIIQKNISDVIQKNNPRESLKIEGIKIVDKTSIPVVIVECGFISNPEEASLLQNEEYQLKIVQGICNGIEEFYN